MKKSSASAKLVRIAAAQLPSPTQADLDRLSRGASQRIDTSDIPPARLSRRPFSPIRQAIIDEMRRQGHTGHRLWKLAQTFCRQLPESAVYEFLAAKRSVRVEYADAMLQALGLRLSTARRKRAG
jgi:hypothetical protein